MAGQTATPAAPGGGITVPIFNPPPCDFSDQFYADNGVDSSSGSELNKEPDGRFGTFRQTGPPATGNQVNWVADTADCSAVDPDRRNFRILATTGGNEDDGNSPFSCPQNPVFDCPPPNGNGVESDTAEFISILAFLHNQAVFVGDPAGTQPQGSNRVVGFINGGLEGVQQNPGITIAINPGQDPQLKPEDTSVPGQPPVTTGLNPRNISQQFIVSNFEAYGPIDQTKNTLKCPAGATTASQCSPAPGNFANAPCSLAMINFLQASFNNGQPAENNGSPVTTLPTFCFNVADTKDSNGNTHSDVETPKLRQNWRFATNRNAMDGSDNNCINDANCASIHDSPFGYFCDDLLGMWIITYFWFTAPLNDPTCGPIYHSIGAGIPSQNIPGNGFAPDGFPIVLTAFELNVALEANQCGAEGQEDPGGTDGGAAWLVCPALQDPRNGAITSDAFLDEVVSAPNTPTDMNIFNQFECLQKKGKFCFESNSQAQ